MNFIIEGDYNRDLISSITKMELPVTHAIIHAPNNPIGNGSIFLPEKLPSFEEFKSYTKFVQDHGIVPIAGIDSTCQGNLEAHIDQFKAIKSFIEDLMGIGYGNVLVSSPNNIAFIKKNYESLCIFLSYSQYVTSTNRTKILFHMGVDVITLHPDILRYLYAMKNLLKLQKLYPKISETKYILPLNIGCNWGCIYWFDHHNMQSHRTIDSPVSSNQIQISDIENAFDFPLLECWKKRLEEPERILKAGWISPFNIENYEKMGYDTFLLLTYGFSTKKTLNILNSYINKSFNGNFCKFLNIPKPYGNYGLEKTIEESMVSLPDNVIKEFVENFPYKHYYPEEDEINDFCKKYIKKCDETNPAKKTEVLSLMEKKLQIIERGAINE